MALIAFSQAMTWSGANDGERPATPRAITGATNLRMCGPTAVVTRSAVAISATTAASSVPEFRARKPDTVLTAAFSPTSWTS